MNSLLLFKCTSWIRVYASSICFEWCCSLLFWIFYPLNIYFSMKKVPLVAIGIMFLLDCFRWIYLFEYTCLWCFFLGDWSVGFVYIAWAIKFMLFFWMFSTQGVFFAFIAFWYFAKVATWLIWSVSFVSLLHITDGSCFPNWETCRIFVCGLCFCTLRRHETSQWLVYEIVVVSHNCQELGKILMNYFFKLGYNVICF